MGASNARKLPMTDLNERNKRGRETLVELGRRFPHLFGMEMWEVHLPMAVGIDA
jgi:hypothetical protein